VANVVPIVLPRRPVDAGLAVDALQAHDVRVDAL
jgi:hypothetical protein